ncbi:MULTISPECIES: hypothetical protein [unclassified Bradyrhizobium]|uniref:hypothetical protein n=1 Tax=unclassified Bradyrhizobium TaxID=2631580 RepID=UPI0028ECDD69|nr:MULTISPECIES: hypothetical protein [unclassified Bradyrhizobium]
MKAEWRERDWSKSKHPERARDYETFLELVLPDGGVIARIEQFTTNPSCFYANTPTERSGCLRSLDWARQWCETKTGNKVN